MIHAWPRKEGAMSPSWSRGDLDLSLFSGICPSVSRLRGQGRAGQGGGRCGCERPKRGSRQFRVRFVFVSPELDPEWELGPRGEGSGHSGPRSRAWRLVPGRAALRRSEGWQALSPEHRVRSTAGGRVLGAFRLVASSSATVPRAAVGTAAWLECWGRTRVRGSE